MLINPYVFASGSSVASCLLHFDGADASTTFVDEYSHAITPAGGVELDTSEKKFGVSSALFDGITGYLTLDDSDLNVSTVEYTVDCWIYMPSTSSGSFFSRAIWTNFNTQAESRVLFHVNASGLLEIYQQGPSGSPSTNFSMGTTVTVNQWNHVAFVQTTTTGIIFLNGVGSTPTALSNRTDFTNICRIGAFDPAGGTFLSPFNGWIDEFRLTVGTARWTSNFTPPAAPASPP